MIRRDYLIVGAGVGGVSACEGIREHDKKGTIMLVGNETTPPYHRPLLLKSYLGKGDAAARGKAARAGHRVVREASHRSAARYDRHAVQSSSGTSRCSRNGQAVEFRKALPRHREPRPAAAGGGGESRQCLLSPLAARRAGLAGSGRTGAPDRGRSAAA